MIKVAHLTQYYSLFKGKRVVDIGCNIGVVTEIIAQYAEKVYGIEKDERWIREPQKDNVEFVNSSMGDFLIETDIDVNAAYASCVLYYLTDEEIDLIRTKLLPKCGLVIFVSYDIKPDLGNNRLMLSKWENINAFLKECGFLTEVKDKDEKWATVIGRKNPN